MSIPSFAKPVSEKSQNKYRYSICTLVTNPMEYGEMVTSFVAAGFKPELCEYLYCDNSCGNRLDAYAACNRFLDSAQGEFVIMCHQDVVLKFDGLAELERTIRKLEQIDPRWALLGNAGGVQMGETAICVTHGDGKHHRSARLPARVQSLDENFILVKRSANLCLSSDTPGFHFYGTDICQIARMLGFSAWVVDFHLLHKSTGNRNNAFSAEHRRICAKYSNLMPSGIIQTPSTMIVVGNGQWKKNRAAYFRLRSINKSGLKTPDLMREKERLIRALGRWNIFVHWCVYRCMAPWCNLARFIARSKLDGGKRIA